MFTAYYSPIISVTGELKLLFIKKTLQLLYNLSNC